MANIQNTLTFNSGFNVTAQAPIDSRLRVQSLADLTAENSWDMSKFPPYNGMIVAVMDTGQVYVLIDEQNPHTLDSWKLTSDSAEVDSILTRLDEAEDKITQNESKITQTSEEINQRVTQVETDLSNEIVTTKETILKQTADEISLLATKEELGETENTLRSEISEQVNDLNGRIESNTTSIQSNSDQIQSTVESITNINGTLESHQTQITQTSDQITSVVETVTEQGTEISTVKQTVNEISSEVASISSDLSETKTTVIQTAEKIEQVATKTETLESSIKETNSTLTQTAEDIRAEVSSIETNLQEQINTNSAELDLTDSKISTAVIQVKEDLITGEIASIKSEVTQYVDGIKTEISEEINGVEGRITTVETNLDGITQRVSNVEILAGNAATKTEVSEIKQQSDEISLTVTSQTEQINKLNTDTGNLETRVSTNESSITELDGKISLKVSQTDFNTLNSTVGEHSATISDQQASIEANTKAIESKVESSTFDTYTGEVAVRFTNVTQTIEGIETRISGAEGNITTIQQDITGITSSLGTAEANIQSLQKQYDGAIDTFFQEKGPYGENGEILYPESEWTNDGEDEEKFDHRDQHLGDIFYNTSDGHAYRYSLIDDDYQWVLITDNALVTALQDIINIEGDIDNLDKKIEGQVKVYYTKPDSYKYGDIWFVERNYSAEETGDDVVKENSIMVANAGSLTGDKDVFNWSHWVLKGDVKTSLSEFNDDITQAVKDSVISESEKKVIAESRKTFESAHKELSAAYTIVTETNSTNQDLDNLISKWSEYDESYVNLIAKVDEIIGFVYNENEPDTSKKNLQTLVDDYGDLYNNYLTKLEEYNKAFAELTETIQSNLSSANDYIADITSDGKLTPIEKKQLLSIWKGIAEEFTANKGIAVNYKIIDSNGTIRTDIYGTIESGNNKYYPIYNAYKTAYDGVAEIFTGSGDWGWSKLEETTSVPEGFTVTSLDDKFSSYYDTLSNFSEMISKITIEITDSHEAAKDYVEALQGQLDPVDEISVVGKGVILSTIVGVKNSEDTGFISALNASNVSDPESGSYTVDNNGSHGRIVFAGGIPQDNNDWNNATTVIYEDGHIKMRSGEISDSVSIGNAIISSIYGGQLNVVAAPVYSESEKMKKWVTLFNVETDSSGNVTAIQTPYNFYSTQSVSALGLQEDAGSGNGGVYYLKELYDVSLTTPTDGQALVYSSSQGKWIASTIDTGLNVSALSTYLNTNGYVTDSELTDYVEGELLNYLPLTGGTITTDSNKGIRIKRNASSAGAGLWFANNSGDLGAIAVDANGNLYFDNNTTAYNILTSAGGTITGELTLSKEGSDIFVINRLNSTSPTTITYRKDDSLLGRMGFNTDGAPVAQVAGTYYNILHSGNVGEYALKIDGSNKMQADKGLAWEHIGTANSDNLGNALFLMMDTSTDSTLTAKKHRYNAVLNVAGNVTQGYRFQIASYAGPGFNELYYRGYDNNNSKWKDWKTIAFTDSTVAAANVLMSTTGIQYSYNFNTDKIFVFGNGVENYKTYIDGSLITLRYGTNNATGFTLNSSGNVTIGAEDKAEDKKLYVDGPTRIDGSLFSQHIIPITDSTYDLGSSSYAFRNVVAKWVGSKTGANLMLGANWENHLVINTSGHVYPYKDNTYVLGLNNRRWGNIFATTLNVSGTSTLTTISNTTLTSTTATITTLKIGSATITYDSNNNALKIEGNLYATGSISSCGYQLEEGTGGASSAYNRLDSWTDYTSDKSGYVLSAGLGSDLNTRVADITSRITVLETNGALTFTTTGDGNVVSSISKSGTAVTVTKGITALPTSGGTLSGRLILSFALTSPSQGMIYIKTGDATKYPTVHFGGDTSWGSFGFKAANTPTYFDNSFNPYILLHSGNYNSYAPTLTGTGASGTWNISISGIAARAACNEGTGDAERHILVTNGNHGLYYSSGVTLNYDKARITAKAFLISSTEPTDHILFSRSTYNYISAPSNANVSIAIGGYTVGAAGSYTFSASDFSYGTTNKKSLGNSSCRWSNVYSVLGNFSGQITSSVADGTAPFVVTSKTVVTNLNATYVGGYSHKYIITSLQDSSSSLDVPKYTDNRPFIWRTGNQETNPGGYKYGNLLHIGYAPNDTAWELYGAYDLDRLYFRRGTWKADGTGTIYTNAWKTIAFTDSDITGKSGDSDMLGGLAASRYFVRNSIITSDTQDADTFGVFGFARLTNSGGDALNWPHLYGYVLNYKGHEANRAGFQLFAKASGNVLLFRRHWDSWGDWKTIAFTDSDITGNVLNSDGDILLTYNDGLILGYGSALKSKNTIIYGNSVVMRYSSNRTQGFILNSSGNVTIGDSDLASTSYKLYVSGNTCIGYNGIYGEGNESMLRGSASAISIGYGYRNLTTDIYGGTIRFYRGEGTTSMLINSDGNVLIGTTTDNGAKLQVAGTATISSTLTVSGTTLAKGSLEIYGTQPYIDFHFNNASDDYTSRIIEIASGNLATYANWLPNTNNVRNLGNADRRWANVYGVNGNFSGNMTIDGNLNVTSAVTMSSTLTVAGKLTISTGGMSVTGAAYFGGGTTYYFGSTGNVNCNTLTAAGVTNLKSTLAVTGATTVNGLITANGGMVIPSSKTLKIGDVIISWDSTGVLKVDGTLYTTGNLSAGGYQADSGSSSSGTITKATYNVLGGIKPLYSTTGTVVATTSSAQFTNSPTIAARTTNAGRYYAIEIDSAGRAFVNVPWLNTTYIKGTNTYLGLIKPWMSRTAASTYNSTSTAPSANDTVINVNAITNTSGRYYAIEMDVNGRAFVNVPWTDTTSSGGTSSIPMIGLSSINGTSTTVVNGTVIVCSVATTLNFTNVLPEVAAESCIIHIIKSTSVALNIGAPATGKVAYVNSSGGFASSTSIPGYMGLTLTWNNVLKMWVSI